jgi:hypothetical protein
MVFSVQDSGLLFQEQFVAKQELGLVIRLSLSFPYFHILPLSPKMWLLGTLNLPPLPEGDQTEKCLT